MGPQPDSKCRDILEAGLTVQHELRADMIDMLPGWLANLEDMRQAHALGA